jgi:hypothetical protein
LGASLLREVWGTDGLRGLRVRRVPGQGLHFRRHASSPAVRGGGGGARACSQIQGLPPPRGEGSGATHVGHAWGGRFDAVVPVSLHRMWLAKRRFNQAELIAKGVVGRIEAPVLDKLKDVRRTRIRLSSPPTSAGRTSRAPTRHEGPWRARSSSSTTSSPPAPP